MGALPIPQGEPDPTAMCSRPFATFVCVSCDHIFAGDIPPVPKDLPRCTLCGAKSWIYRILEQWLEH